MVQWCCYAARKVGLLLPGGLAVCCVFASSSNLNHHVLLLEASGDEVPHQYILSGAWRAPNYSVRFSRSNPLA
ncbi:hypothetical protein QBC35DRAFT_488431 [Podospora australis]|uniref:Uncharacterized protein n=1 Tax=Podospora australis TaxID=1536484 RepID=A0AAN6X067_9PEZI|nr:hypothetical protein QBC35DRAFT_488431 [Podospora australis]